MAILLRVRDESNKTDLCQANLEASCKQSRMAGSRSLHGLILCLQRLLHLLNTTCTLCQGVTTAAAPRVFHSARAPIHQPCVIEMLLMALLWVDLIMGRLNSVGRLWPKGVGAPSPSHHNHCRGLRSQSFTLCACGKTAINKIHCRQLPP